MPVECLENKFLLLNWVWLSIKYFIIYFRESKKKINPCCGNMTTTEKQMATCGKRSNLYLILKVSSGVTPKVIVCCNKLIESKYKVSAWVRANKWKEIETKTQLAALVPQPLSLWTLTQGKHISPMWLGASSSSHVYHTSHSLLDIHMSLFFCEACIQSFFFSFSQLYALNHEYEKVSIKTPKCYSEKIFSGALTSPDFCHAHQELKISFNIKTV